MQMTAFCAFLQQHEKTSYDYFPVKCKKIFRLNRP